MFRQGSFALPCVLTAVVACGADRPNVLFLFSDDQQADTIRALGNRSIETPNLDRLVEAGTVFTRAYCMGSQQGAVCIPSRAMMLSGRTLFRVPMNLAGTATWPEVLARNGYVTFGIGKWHNQPASFVRVFQRGEAVFFGGMSDPYKLQVQDLDADHKLTPRRVGDKHSSELLADTAIRFLHGHRGDRPFALYVAFTAPHDPRVAPPEYRSRYDPSRMTLPANFLPQHPFDNGEMTVRDEKLAPWPRTPEIVREHLADYYAAITYLDAQIGRVLDALRETGQADKTLIIFASDHGLAIGSHGLFGKQNLYEHSMRAPLVFAGPGVPRGKRSDAMCYLLDIFPTLCDLAGVAVPDSVEGRSLAPVLAGNAAKGRETIFTAYAAVQRAVRDERWKLIVYPRAHKTQLFDLAADPEERHDLAGEPAHAAEVTRLAALLAAEQRRADDPQPWRGD
jgi:arylsulfatase A-like enzyme